MILLALDQDTMSGTGALHKGYVASLKERAAKIRLRNWLIVACCVGLTVLSIGFTVVSVRAATSSAYAQGLQDATQESDVACRQRIGEVTYNVNQAASRAVEVYAASQPTPTPEPFRDICEMPTNWHHCKTMQAVLKDAVSWYCIASGLWTGECSQMVEAAALDCLEGEYETTVEIEEYKNQ